MHKQFIALLIIVLALVWAAPVSAQERDANAHTAAQVPDRPVEQTAEEVKRETAMAREHRHHDDADLSKIVEAFSLARSRQAVDYLAGMALAILHEHGVAPDNPRAQELYRRYSEAANSVPGNFTSGYPGSAACPLDFDTPAVLAGFPDDAQSTFTSPPHWVEACGDGVLTVEPTVYSHYHLSYEDSTIDCIDPNGMFGRGEPGNCVALADPAQEPRYLGSHYGDEVIRIRLISGGAALPFSLETFANVGPTAVKFRYQTQGGQWFVWNSMAGHTSWDVSAFVNDVVEIRITNADTSESCGLDWETSEPGGCPAGAAPFFLDDFAVNP